MKSIFIRIIRILRALGLLGSLALPLAAATAPSTVRLQEITVTKFVTVDGQSRVQEGQLLAAGGFRLVQEDPTATQVPASLQGKPLIYTEAWFAFASLGPDAIRNFELRSAPITIAGLVFYEVGVREDAMLAVGTLANLSSRGMVTDDERLIGGLVIDGAPRRVLIRALGPALAAVGMTNALPDPYLTLFHGTMPLYYNDDWSNRPDAAEIAQVTARVGAPPLPAGSRDAALLVELPPGVYTAHVEPESGGGGVTLLEIFSVPD